MNLILKYNIKLRLAEYEDAQFIFRLRTDPNLNKNISKTIGTIDDQVKWLEAYKKREKAGLEYYFITEDFSGNKMGTTRIYNTGNHFFTLGSWVFLREAPHGYAIKADIITKGFGFESLDYINCRFDVRKENQTVIKYHKLFNPSLIDEDNLNYYFELSRENFLNNKLRIINLF